MEQKQTEVSKNNASASAFGWQFQVEAGIFLMLSDLKNNIELNIEAYDQDIEITTKDETLIMAQAKSSREYYEPINKSEKAAYSKKVRGHLKNALTGLCKSLQRKRKRHNKKIKLVYISNFHKPFGHKAVRIWDECEVRSFAELEPYEKLAVEQALGNDVHSVADVLLIQNLPFDASVDVATAHKYVLRKIRLLFKDLGINDIYAEDYLQKIHLLCNYNAFNATFTCKSGTFIWIAVAFGFDFDERSFQKIFPHVDEQKTVERIKKKYKGIIQSHISRFRVCKDVLSRFENYETQLNSLAERTMRFIEEHSDILDSIISNDMPDDERAALKKYILYQIISSKFFIDKANSNFIVDED